MKPSEARRRLRRLGWSEERLAGSSHAYWRTPSGGRRLMALGHGNAGKIDRNKVAEIRRAERAAMQTTKKEHAVQTPELEVNVEETVTTGWTKFEPNIRIYCGGLKKPFADLFLGRVEADHLGGPGVKVAVRELDGAWMLVRDEHGANSLVQKGSFFHVRTRRLSAVVPPTGCTFLPAEVVPDGFVLHPDLVEPVSVKEAPSRPKPVAGPPSSPPQSTPLQAEPVKRNGSSLDDLRTALEMLRTIAAEVGAELYLDDDAIVRARIVI